MKSAGTRLSAKGMPGHRPGSSIGAHFWGTRGSYAVSDRHFTRYGGNTACVEVRLGERLFIIDAGSGIIDLGSEIAREGVTRIDILLSHLHHDHILGLGFFEPLFKQGTTVTLHCGNLEGDSGREVLSTLFRPPLFPIPLSELAADLRFVGFRAGETLSFPDGTTVRTCPLNHPGGACGYRFDHQGHSLCYLSDMEHTEGGPPTELLDFVGGADLVIYDGMFTADEYERYRGWGHSTWQEGVALCRRGGAKALALFHHHPRRTDSELDAIGRLLATALPGSFCARERHSALQSTETQVGMIQS